MHKQDQLNIWERIKKVFTKIFNKNHVLLIDELKEEKSDHIKESNIRDEFSKTRRILMLQAEYNSGAKKTNEISDEDKDELIKLYKEQIETLKYNIDIKKNELKGYKKQN